MRHQMELPPVTPLLVTSVLQALFSTTQVLSWRGSLQVLTWATGRRSVSKYVSLTLFPRVAWISLIYFLSPLENWKFM